MTLTLLIAYIVATLAFCLTPGPAVLLVSSQAASRGFGAGVLAVCGIMVAEAVYWTVSLLGLTAVLVNSELAFTIVKYAGAAYLLALGVLTISGARKKATETSAAPPTAPWTSPFAQGMVGQFANPKSVLFFIAFLPQFITPGVTTPLDIALLVAIGMGGDLVVLGGYAWLAAHSKALFRNPAQILWRERVAGSVQIAVGGMIAVMRRAA